MKISQENDPEEYKLLLKKTNVSVVGKIRLCRILSLNYFQKLKDAANRWIDNIFATKSWCKKKFFIEDNVLNKQFGIPEDLDYLE